MMCEGGGELAKSLLSQQLADKLIIYQATKKFGEEGVPFLGPQGADSIELKANYSLVEVSRIGPDARLVYERKR